MGNVNLSMPDKTFTKGVGDGRTAAAANLVTLMRRLRDMRKEKGELEKDVKATDEQARILMIQAGLQVAVYDGLQAKIIPGKNETISKSKLVKLLNEIFELNPDEIDWCVQQVTVTTEYDWCNVSEVKPEGNDDGDE